jgi:hypothetical protein
MYEYDTYGLPTATNGMHSYSFAEAMFGVPLGHKISIDDLISFTDIARNNGMYINSHWWSGKRTLTNEEYRQVID